MKYPFVVLNVLLTSFMFAGCWHDINCLPDSHFTDEGKIKSEYLPDSSLENELAENVKFFIGRSLNFPWQAPEVLTKDGAYTIQEERDVRNAMQLCSESFDL